MFTSLFLMLAAPAHAVVPGKLGDLIITELQADSAEVAQYYGEWIELYNNSGVTLDLAGVTLERDGQSMLITAPVAVGAGDYFVLGVSEESTTGNAGYNGGVEVDLVYAFADFNLSAPDDVLRVRYDGLLLDEVDWDSSWAFSTDHAQQVQPNASANEWANDLTFNWCPSDTLIVGQPETQMYGTPGFDNEACGTEYNTDNDGDGFAEFEGDCDDEHADINPDAVDGVASPHGVADDDADCDGVRDDGITDDDGDGWTEVAGDCDDGAITSYPGAIEDMDGVDNDCNGCVDDVDDDGDGWTECKVECDSDGDGDIDASDVPCYDCIDDGTEDYENLGGLEPADVNPDAEDAPYDGTAADCDGVDQCDVDGDGYSATSAYGPGCSGQDCDDSDKDVHPGAVETLNNGRDDDCDGVIDLPDRDGDGYTAEEGDCMDLGEGSGYTGAQLLLASQTHPGATELCFDLVDNDCDGFIDNLPACGREAATATVRGGGVCGVVDAGGGALGVVAIGLLATRRRRNVGSR